MNLEPMICGEWDGSSVWLQWTPQGDDTAYEVEILLHKTEAAAESDKWMRVVPRQGEKSHWAVIPVWKENWFAEARVRIKGASEDAWETAVEVNFDKCTALFEFSSSKYYQHFDADTPFHAQVDAAACAYVLKEAIEVLVGGSTRVEMEALGASGYFQLDYPGHFYIKPSFGLVVQNVEPSRNDVSPTGRKFTQIKPKKIPDLVTMSVSPPTRF